MKLQINIKFLNLYQMQLFDSEKGITAQLIKLNINDNIGANKKIKLELLGKVVSFANNFKPSARACK
jgi:hypothetical protein